MSDQDRRRTHHRTMDAVVLNPEIMDTAKAVDWRVLHAIELHQGYKTWRCRVSLDRIAKIARCSKKGAGNSSRWWQSVGAIRIRRSGRFNEYEIVQDFRPSPEIVHGQRHISHKTQKRGSRGQFAPSTALQSPPCTALQSPRSTAYTTRSLSSDVFNKSPLSAPPQGGNRLRSETSSDAHTPPLISKETLREIQKAKGRVWLEAYMKDRGFPLSLLPEEEKPSPRGEENQTNIGANETKMSVEEQHEAENETN